MAIDITSSSTVVAGPSILLQLPILRDFWTIEHDEFKSKETIGKIVIFSRIFRRVGIRKNYYFQQPFFKLTKYSNWGVTVFLHYFINLMQIPTLKVRYGKYNSIVGNLFLWAFLMSLCQKISSIELTLFIYVTWHKRN